MEGWRSARGQCERWNAEARRPQANNLSLYRSVLSLNRSETLFAGVESLEGVNKVVDSLELSIHRCEAHVGDFTELFELLEHHLANVLAGDLTVAALLQGQFQLVNHMLEPACRNPSFLASTTKPVQQFRATEGFSTSVAL